MSLAYDVSYLDQLLRTGKVREDDVPAGDEAMDFFEIFSHIRALEREVSELEAQREDQ